MGSNHHRNAAFTRIELLVVGLILALLVGVLVPAMIQRKRTEHLATCVSNLKQVMLAELLWINDNEKSRLSWQTSTNERGTLEYLNGGKLFPHIRALSNELVTPRILICPADNRRAANGFGNLSDSNFSYFMNINPQLSFGGVPPVTFLPEHIIFGDRNITNKTGPQAGIIRLTMSNYISLGWDSRVHNQSKTPSHSLIGNVAYLDGAVATVTPTNLQKGFYYDVLSDSAQLVVP